MFLNQHILKGKCIRKVAEENRVIYSKRFTAEYQKLRESKCQRKH